MKSRNHLHAALRTTRLSRNNWRDKCKALEAKQDRAKSVIKYLLAEVVKLECELNQLKRRESKEYGWQAFNDKYVETEV